MRLIVGLGNPGAAYLPTRHNLGRNLVEEMARHFRLSFSTKKNLSASFAELREGETVLLAYPELFMNHSGEAVRKLTDYFSIDSAKDLLVLVDDAALPFGDLRLRPQGSDGGHNGLKSVNQMLGSDDYPRLRLGIGAPEKNIPLEDYVLASFTAEEKKALPGFLKKGMEAVLLWISQPITQAMNAVNASDKRG